MCETAVFDLAGLGFFPSSREVKALCFVTAESNTLLTYTTMGWSSPSFHRDL